MFNGQAASFGQVKSTPVCQGWAIHKCIDLSEIFGCSCTACTNIQIPIFTHTACPTVVASKKNFKRHGHWEQALNAKTLAIPRTREVFERLEVDSRMTYMLPPKPNMTAGSIIKHCYEVVENLLDKYKPCIYKIGITHCPHFRFDNAMFGYAHERDKWTALVVIYASHESISPAFVEGALIQKYKGNLTSNICIVFFPLFLLFGINSLAKKSHLFSIYSLQMFGYIEKKIYIYIKETWCLHP